jgi:hypothetical protein
MGPLAPVLPVIATVASIGGTVLGAMASIQQGKYQEAVAKAQAKAAARQAQEVQAVGQREAVERARAARMVQSRQLALTAAGGGGTGDASILKLMAQTGAEGQQQVANTVYDTQVQGNALNYQGDIYRMQGRNARNAGYVDAFSTVLGGVSNAAQSWGAKYGYG